MNYEYDKSKNIINHWTILISTQKYKSLLNNLVIKHGTDPNFNNERDTCRGNTSIKVFNIIQYLFL